MTRIIVALYLSPLFICYTKAIGDSSFPKNFTLGVASSAYQIEGAWNYNGKGESIWDHDLHENRSLVIDESNGDIADDAFFEEYNDIVALVALGVNHYKFYIAWSRLLPEGVYNNETEGFSSINHYNALIEDLKKHNIEPIVTLYHLDLPQPIQQWGGWTNESTIDLFVSYAKYVFDWFDKDIKYFITFDDPKEICKSGYGDGTLAPFLKNSGIDDYKCARIILKAHAAVYNLFKTNYTDAYPGCKISMTLDGSWSQPASDTKKDTEAAERRNQFEFGLYANPIFKNNWPDTVIKRVTSRCNGEKTNATRLPIFSDKELAAIKGTADFMAVDFFDTYLVADDKEAPFGDPSYNKDMRVLLSRNKSWIVDADNHAIVKGSLRKFLKYIKDNYNDPEILITGNGIADNNGTTHDGDRVTFISEQLTEVLQAINEDGVKVFGYTYWSLMDSFEWTRGKIPHFGLHSIDLNLLENPTRISKRSAFYYALTNKVRRVPDPSELITTSTTLTTTPTTIYTHPTRHRTPTTSTQIPETSTKGGARCNFLEKGVSAAVVATLLLMYQNRILFLL